MNKFHVSVLLHESIHFLQVRQGGRYIDATIGGGGHTLEILKKGGSILGIDVDEEALGYVRSLTTGIFTEKKPTLRLEQGNFKDIQYIAETCGFTDIDGVLFDIGVSNHQLDEDIRGFSFLKNAPLDMRMDKRLQVTAKDLINGLTKKELQELFMKLGEEPYANAIANEIIKSRRATMITTTSELAQLVARVYQNRHSRLHPATKVFQALRIAVNDELNNIKNALPQAMELLRNKGRVVFISFHSLEDRIVKQKFLEFQENGLGKIITKKPIRPSQREIEQNIRSRSAKMRVFEKHI